MVDTIGACHDEAPLAHTLSPFTESLEKKLPHMPHRAESIQPALFTCGNRSRPTSAQAHAGTQAVEFGPLQQLLRGRTCAKSLTSVSKALALRQFAVRVAVLSVSAVAVLLAMS